MRPVYLPGASPVKVVAADDAENRISASRAGSTWSSIRFAARG